MRPLRRAMFALAVALATLAALPCSRPAHAFPTVSLSWNGCTGSINANPTAGGSVAAFLSLLGQTQTAQSYQCVTVGAQPGGFMRDAWRFDPGGCESGRFTLDHLAPASVAKACPSFQGALPSLQIKDYAFDGSHGGKVRITLANAYPNGGAGNPDATNPAQRYFLAGYEFDLSLATTGPSDPSAGTCGGLDVPACFVIVSASWLDLAGTEQFWFHGSDFLTTNDPANDLHCPDLVPVPARARTWGGVKSQYRQ